MENPGPLPSPPTIGDSQTAILSAPAQDPRAQFARLELERGIKNGANWFYWIAGLTVVNSISLLSGSDWGFALGLTITQIIDYLARSHGAAGKVAALAVDVFAIGFFILLGVLANKRYKWPFIVGLVCYGLDAALTLVSQAWIGIVIHVWALWAIWVGYRKIQKLHDLGRFRALP